MKTEFGIKNFKIFDENGVKIDFNPITILTGTNGSGKSSITKAVVLLQDYMKRVNEALEGGRDIGAVPFELSNAQHLIGASYCDSVNRDSKSDLMTFSYKTNLFSSSKYVIEVSVTFQPSHNDSYYKGGWIKQLSLTCNDEPCFDAYYDKNNKLDYMNCSIPSSMRKAFMEYCEISLLREWVSYIDREAHLYTGFVETDLGISEEEYIHICSKIDVLAKYIISNKNHLASSFVTFKDPLLKSSFRNSKIEYYELPKIHFLHKTISDTSLEETLMYFKDYDIFFFFPVLKQFVGKSKDESLKILKNYYPQENAFDQSCAPNHIPQSIVDRICEDYSSSPFDSFIDYYRHIEMSELSDIASWPLPISPLSYNYGQFGKQDLFEYYVSPKSTEYKHELIDDSNGLYKKVSHFMSIGVDDFWGLSVHDSHHECWSARFLREAYKEGCGEDDVLKRQKVSFDLLSYYVCNFQFDTDKEDIHTYFREIRFSMSDISSVWESKIYENYIKFFELVIKTSLASYPQRLEFIGNFRAKIERVYSLSESSGDQYNKSIKEYLLYISKHRNADKNKAKFYPGKFLNKWLKQFGIARELRFKVDDEGAGAKLYLISLKNGTKVPLADEGYGVTQIIAFLIQIELAILKDTCTLCLEEPESGLHPDYQSKLADIFYDAYLQHNLHFVVETHSEYLIRAFQAIVAKTVNSTEDLEMLPFIVHYVDKGGQTYDLEFSESGRFNRNFGTGFFDEAGRLCVEILRKEKRLKDAKKD